MLWDYDLSPAVHKVKLPPPGSFQSRLAAPDSDTSFSTSWGWEDLNPDIPVAGIELARRTVWLQDDLFYICRKYYMESEEPYPEILDLTKYPEDKRDIYAKTARTFHFITFMPKDIEDEEEVVSSDSDLDDLDDDDFDIDST